MKRTFNRSKSYTEQGYVPVATEESEAEEVFASNSPSIKRSSPRRTLSDSGADKAKRSFCMSSMESNTESNMSTAQPEREEFIPMEKEPEQKNAENRQRLKGNKKIILVIVLFSVSLVLHLYSLADFLQENNNSSTDTSRLKGSNKNKTDTALSNSTRCLLTINYEKYIEGVDKHRDCSLVTIQDVQENITDYEHCVGDLYLLKKCLCTKQIHHPKGTCGPFTLKNYQCNNCSALFPDCQNGGIKVGCGTKCLLTESDCGVCSCPGNDFTGNYCHLPKKLECSSCLGNDCGSLPPCNNRTEYPCQYTSSFNSKVMNCTKQENKNAKDCTAEQNKTNEKDPIYNKLISNDAKENKCLRTSKIGFFVLDWIVFVALLFHISHAICQRICCTGKKCIPDMLEEDGKLNYAYFVSALLLVVIPPIVNCITCCSTACDVIGKVLPFIKAGFLVAVLFLLRVILRVRDEKTDNR
ncbi:uncharacterized protein LOC133176158 [Saccostrea echinata]|uniref:uncharacterized protein LOC133176158 n=1 Tax=Saccostrea echinata TaxID=191078 RepID=UPI002A81A18A|nr:uncharacterized protein LOC133176158 [Saccostrea echinata]